MLGDVAGLREANVHMGTSGSGNKAGLLVEKIKWALWKEAEVKELIEDLERSKLKLNLEYHPVVSYGVSFCAH